MYYLQSCIRLQRLYPILNSHSLNILHQRHRSKKYKAILGIDDNESFISNREDVARLCSKCKLIYPIAQNHSIQNKPNTYIRGSQRIDCMFHSKEISGFIIACGILPFGHILSSDHRSIYLDIKSVQYLRNPFIDTNVNNSWLLQSNRPLKVRKYKEISLTLLKKERLSQQLKICNKNSSIKHSPIKIWKKSIRLTTPWQEEWSKRRK